MKEIGSPGSEDAAAAFTQPLAETGEAYAEDGLVEVVMDEVEGYPYFIQLCEAELWDAAEMAGVDLLTQELLNLARPDVNRRLDVAESPRSHRRAARRFGVLPVTGSGRADWQP